MIFHLTIIAGVFSKPEGALTAQLLEFQAWLQAISQPVVIICLILGVLLALIGHVLGIHIITGTTLGKVFGGVFIGAVILGYGPELVRSIMAGGA